MLVWNKVEGPASAAEKLSAFFVSAPVYRRASDFTVKTRREAEMRTALIVAITLAFAIGAPAQNKEAWSGR